MCACCMLLVHAQANRGLKEADVVAVLKKVPVKLGSGKTQVGGSGFV